MRDEVFKQRDDFSSGTFGRAEYLFRTRNNEKMNPLLRKPVLSIKPIFTINV